jgi:hypothetical protein
VSSSISINQQGIVMFSMIKMDLSFSGSTEPTKTDTFTAPHEVESSSGVILENDNDVSRNEKNDRGTAQARSV